MRDIHIAMATDRNYLVFVSIVITSLLDNFNREDRLTLHLLLNGSVVPDDLAPLRELQKRRDFALQEHFIDKERFIKDWGTDTAILYRCELPNICPDLDRIIYLDCDLVVLDDIAKLWDLDLKDNVLAGVSDRAGRKTPAASRVPENEYVNSGVLVMDLQKMRAVDAVKQMAHLFSTKRENFLFIDQDLLNHFFRGRIMLFPPQWNIFNSLFRHLPLENTYSNEELAEAFRHPGIAHFSDRYKPWLFFRSVHHPFASWFWHYAMQAPIPRSLKIKMFLKRFLWGRFKDSPDKRPWNYQMTPQPQGII